MACAKLACRATARRRCNRSAIYSHNASCTMPLASKSLYELIKHMYAVSSVALFHFLGHGSCASLQRELST
eukprot:6174110-Pleurochrysis_carterae.AAC.1